MAGHAKTCNSNKFQRTLFLLCCYSLLMCSESFLVDTNPYRHLEALDGEGKYVLEWKVDWESKRVIFNVTAETTGYVGFGLSRRGKMSGADIVIGGVSPNGKPYFSDRHAIGHQLPVEDAHQDWTLHTAWESGTHTFLSFSRPFDTCDKEDYAITEDVISIIWAFGENDDVVEYHFQHRGAHDVYLLDPDLTPRIAQPLYRTKNPKELGDLKVWSINKMEVLPPKETFYTCSFHKAPRFPKKQHMVGFNTAFHTDLERQHLHSFFVYRCHPPAGRDAAAFFERYVRNRGEECYTLEAASKKIPTLNCREPVHIWAVGGKAVFLPEHVGIPMSESSNEYYMIQAHYENPEKVPGIRLRYSLEIFYTNNIREHDAGVMITGHTSPGSPSLLIPPSSLGHVIYGQCGSSCTRQMLPQTGIQVFATSMHTHTTGRGARLLHIRDNQELPWVSFDDNYNFNFQQTRILRKERTVLPGDLLVNRCTYETAGKGYSIVGGVTLRNEICIGVMWYYNRIRGYGVCNSEIRSQVYYDKLGFKNATWSNARLEMVINSPANLAGMGVTELTSRHTKWTISRRNQLQDDHRNLPQINQCPKLIPGMEDVRQLPVEDDSLRPVPTLQRYIPKSGHSSTLLHDSEFVSIYPKETIPYNRPHTCVKSTKQIIQVNTNYQSPIVGPFPTQEWWSIDSKSQGYNLA